MKIWTSRFNNYFQSSTIECVKDSNPTIVINSQITYQKHLGFGGAFTDAACHIFLQMNDAQQSEIINLLFKEEGLNYNLGRLTIGSCDFSTKDYDYATNFSSDDFSLDYEKKYIDPFLLKALNLKKLTLICAPWSPPKFYKTTGDKNHGGQLLKDHYADYARYLCRYIEEQQKRHIPLKYMTMQNEPEATQPWESCVYSAQEELELLKAVQNESKNHQMDIEYLLWDHNRDVLPRRVNEYLQADKNFISSIAGFAYHWYDGDKWDNLSIVHHDYPDKLLLFTEGCIELLSLDPSNPKNAIGTINNAFRYAKNYINDSLNFANGFIDWNLLLDEHGGPNHVGNFCEALIQYDLTNKNIIINPSYYVVKHFAHFIKPNAYRIDVKNDTSCLITSYLNPDQSIVVVILNEGKECNQVIQINGKTFNLHIPALSVTTCIL